MTGKEIENLFFKHKLSSLIFIEKLIPMKYHLEILCKPEEDKDVLQRNLKNNNHLNRELNFTT